MGYVWSKLSRKLLPTIDEMVWAIYQAEAPLNADPRPLLYTLTQLPVADGKFLGLQLSVTDAVTGYDWDIVPNREFQDDEAVRKLAAQAHDRMLASGIEDHFDAMLGAEFFGISALHCVWENSIGGKLVPTIDVVPATEITYRKFRGLPTYLRISDQVLYRQAPIADPDQYVITRFNPFKLKDPYFVGGLYRAAMPLIILKHFGFQDLAHFIEIFADPTVLGKYKRTASNDDKKAAWSMIEQMGRDKRLLVSEDIMLEFITAVKDGSPQAYATLIDKVDNELTILMAGATMSTDVQDKGSKAVATVHQKKEDNRTWRRLKMIERPITSQYLRTDWRLNESETQPMPYHFGFSIDEAVDYESNARIVTELAAAGYDLEDAEVSEKTGFTVIKSATPKPNITAP